MSRFLLTVSLSFALSCHAGSLWAQGDSHAGKAKSASCAGCHGEDGNTTVRRIRMVDSPNGQSTIDGFG